MTDALPAFEPGWADMPQPRVVTYSESDPPQIDYEESRRHLDAMAAWQERLRRADYAERVRSKRLHRMQADLGETRSHLDGMVGAMVAAGLIETPPKVCAHPNAVPVALILTGEVVARLCPDCDQQLPVPRETLEHVDHATDIRDRLA